MADRAKRRQRRKFGRIRQFNSGRWQASYTGPDANVYIAPSTFDAKVDAEAWLADRRREIDRELWSPSSGQEERPGAPFGDYAEAWIGQRGIKDRTREHYRKLLDNHILPTFTDVELRDITPASVRRWYATTAVGTLRCGRRLLAAASHHADGSR
jgi:Phage integrase, N-terminal SAM-like domain